MRSDRLLVQLPRLATASVAAAMVYALWIRPRMLRWGVTPDEASHTYPGDELVPDPGDGGDDGHDPACTSREGLAMARADGR
jgi:hypothetical protein